ncbi:MAG: 2-dehydropantoate 2-reductase [Myxococcota bacterium]
MHVGVMGAGSIGCFVGGSMLAAHTANVTFVGRDRVAAEVATHGLRIQDFDRRRSVPPERVQFFTEAKALERCDAVLVAVKSAQTVSVAKSLAAILRKGALVVSLQNGVRNGEALREHLPNQIVVAAVVGFNVVSQGDGFFHRAMGKGLMLEDRPEASALVAALKGAGLDVSTHSDLAPHQWTKLVVNLNNAVSALSNAPSRALLLQRGFRRTIVALIEEALAVLGAAGIRAAPLRGVPVKLMPSILRLPTPLVRVVARAQFRVNPEARSSMWEDLMRGRPTEVDFLNGEIVRLAAHVGVPAPRNRRVVELIKKAEAAGDGSPGLTAEALWHELHVGVSP